MVHFARSIHSDAISVPNYITGMILARFDHLHPDAQLVLKCASVLETTFSHSMLATIVPNMTEQIFNQIIASLTGHGLAQCHYTAQLSDQSSSTQQLTEEVKCTCILLCLQYSIVPSASVHLVSSPNHSAVLISEWQLLQFVHPYMHVRETLYDLWTHKQRTDLHERAALFLES